MNASLVCLAGCGALVIGLALRVTVTARAERWMMRAHGMIALSAQTFTVSPVPIEGLPRPPAAKTVMFPCVMTLALAWYATSTVAIRRFPAGSAGRTDVPVVESTPLVTTDATSATPALGG